MSIPALTWMRTQMPRDGRGQPDPYAKCLLMALADRADANGYCWPSQGLLSADTGMGETTVGKKAAVLEAQGYMRRQSRKHTKGPRKGQKTSDAYYLDLTRPPDDTTRSTAQPPGLRRGREPGKAAVPPKAAPPRTGSVAALDDDGFTPDSGPSTWPSPASWSLPLGGIRGGGDGTEQSE